MDEELVRNGDEWHSLCVELDRGKLVFYYDGLPVARTPLKTGRQPRTATGGIRLVYDQGSNQRHVSVDRALTTRESVKRRMHR